MRHPLPVRHIVKTDDGFLYLGWSDGYAIRSPAAKWKTFPFQFKTATGTVTGKMVKLIADQKGRAWAIGSGGAKQFRGFETVREISGGQSTLTSHILHYFQAADGSEWLTSPRGLCRLEDGRCAVLDKKRWLKSDWTLELAEWPQGTMWISTFPDGLIRILPPNYTHYALSEGIIQFANAAMQDLNGYLFLTNAVGLTRFDPRSKRFDHFRQTVGIPKNQFGSSVRLHTNAILISIGSSMQDTKQLVLFDGQRLLQIDNEKTGLPDERILSFCEHEPGRALVSYHSGIRDFDTIIMKSSQATFAHLLADSPATYLACAPTEPIFVLNSAQQLYRIDPTDAVLIDPGKLGFVGDITSIKRTRNAGIFVIGEKSLMRYDQNHWQIFKNLPKDYTDKIRAIDSDEQGRIYFASEAGVLVTNGEVWTLLTNQDGLIATETFGLYFYDQRLWISGNGGLAEWWWPKQKPPESYILARGHAYYTDSTGSPQSIKQSDGYSKAGWVQLRGLMGEFEIPEQLAPNFLPNQPSEQKTANRKADTESTKRDTQPTQNTQEPHLVAGCEPEPYQDANLEFKISAQVPFVADRPEDFHYHYRLDQGEWIQVTRGEIQLSDLDDGQHQLQLRATDRRLQTDPTPVNYCFTVQKPIPLWAYAAFGAILLSLLFVLRRPLLYVWHSLRYRNYVRISPSPFHPDSPAEGSMLKDKQEHIDAIASVAQTGGVAVLWGDQGTGKRSLLRHLATSLDQRQALVIQFDLAVITAGSDIARMITTMTTELMQVLQDNQDNLYDLIKLEDKNIDGRDASVTSDSASDDWSHVFSDQPSSSAGSQSEDNNPFSALHALLRKLQRNFGQLELVFLLDNAEVLSLAMESDAAFGSYLFPFFRSLCQQQLKVTIVLTIEGRYFQLVKSFEQLFSYATPVAMGLIRPTQARELFTQAFANKAFLPPLVMDRLVSLCGGHPTTIQTVGDRIVTELNIKKSNRLTHARIEQMIDLFLDDMRTLFEHRWQNLSREEKLVLVALEGLADSQRNQLDAMIAYLSEQGANLLPEEGRRALLALQLDGVTDKHGDQAHVLSDLFRLWIQRSQTLQAVLEESQNYIGHYQLLERLGSGGMGVVYKARDMLNSKTVAIKLMQPDLSDDKRSRRRFLREAKLGKRIKHTNIAKIVDYGEQQGRLYLAIEFIEGPTLSKFLKKNGPIKASLVAKWGQSIAAALSVIHKIGIVHRDVKSSNIMLSALSDAKTSKDHANSIIKLMDFGLAVGDDVSRMTQAGTILGSLAYMSPEQATGSMIDSRSDLYSVGVVLFEMLTGELPFCGTKASVLTAIIHDSCPDIDPQLYGINQEFVELIQQLLKKDPDDRPQNAQEVKYRLIEIADNLKKKSPSEKNKLQQATVPGARSGNILDLSITRSVYKSRTLRMIKTTSDVVSSLSSVSDITSILETGLKSAKLLIYSVSASVAKSRMDKTLFRNCLNRCIQSLEAQRGLILLRQPDADLECVAAVNREVDSLHALPILMSLIQQTIEGQMGILFKADETEIEHEMGAVVCAPLWAGDKILGSILLDRTGIEAKPFEDEDLELLVCVGYLLGLGLEREHLNKQILEQEKMVVAGQMLAGVAHDMRNPMSVISGYTQLLTDIEENEQLIEFCDVINHQVKEMAGMINNLLSYVRSEHTLEPTQISLVQLAQEIQTSLRIQAEQKEIKFSVQSDLSHAFLDASRTKRIILNLSKNALESLPKGGSLTVHMHKHQSGGMLCKVCDNGPGIPEDIRPKLFEPFTTKGKKTGTGLGMAIVKRFVDDHSGTISYESSAQTGTTFTVVLPRAAQTRGSGLNPDMVTPNVNLKSSEIQRAEYLWRCTRALLSPGTQAEVQPDDWDDLISFLEINQLDGYLFDKLRSHKNLDNKHREYLSQRIREEHAAGMMTDHLLDDILTTLAAADIICMPIKGVVFRNLLYPEPAFRNAQDIDICVQKQDFEKAHALLSDKAYVRVDGALNRPVTKREVYERAYQPPKNKPQILVDIHNDLTKQNRYPSDYEGVWNRSLSTQAFRNRIGTKHDKAEFPETENIRLMSPEDALVHQFLHNGTHCFDMPARWLTDLSLIIERWSPDWDQVLRLVVQSKLQTAAYFSLCAAKFMVDSAHRQTIDKVLVEIEPSWAKKIYLTRFISPEGNVRRGAARLWSIQFADELWGLRSQQFLIGFFLVDGFLQPARFALDYLSLRIRDLYQHATSTWKRD